ncbi:MAG TPA: IS200/IS605 family transposase [Candidatus Cloacimonas acidaminovorans]|jgi:REP element-mobilizing transposase RayT|nr:IS200/IS605 family transposase [Candidatus Cloacimonas acidaminovorans]HRS60894.1 IS200/IS605 family transposase [Candidatus Cloacimonas sp.]HOM78590.1 IS200/IS605 family transposase [Candidatus Cloacimonas acidaminovorans]HOS07297.1 IS200/IS605 family transposase [Candidatus Cloacimonas acidaminovorans]HOT38923.1 IS200/IS605 family transposase [Candidatus Cloacimonas acidaminovorans]
MPNSFTQLYIHYVFIVQERECALKPEIQERFYPYLVSLIHQKKCVTIAINGTENHIHLLVKMHPDVSISELAKFAKANSSHWANEIRLFPHRFHWQEGYGAFSVSQSMFETVVKYIENQVEHHKHQTVQEEYELFLKKHKIEYNPKYLPK